MVLPERTGLKVLSDILVSFYYFSRVTVSRHLFLYGGVLVVYSLVPWFPYERFYKVFVGNISR